MPKNWWFKFDFRVWRTDTDLRRCSLETRGFWLECICAMHEAEQYKIEGTFEEIGRLIGCPTEVAARCILELKRTETATVLHANNIVKITSRRMKRELKERKQTRLRVEKHRSSNGVSNAPVTPQSKSKSNKEEREEYTHRGAGDFLPESGDWTWPMKPFVDAFPSYLPDRITPAMIGFIEAEVLPGDEMAWANTLKTYQMNFNPQTSSYLPDKTANVLSVFRNEKARLLKDGSSKGHNGNRKRTDQDVIAESADFYANWQGDLAN